MRTPAPPRRSTRSRWAWCILVLLVVVLVVLIGRAVWQLRTTPVYWEANQAFLSLTPPPQLDVMARSVEARLPAEFTRPIGPGEGPRTLRINFDEANAWFAVRLEPYLENQNVELPPQLGQFMLTQRDDQLVLAFDYTSSQLGQRVASLFIATRPAPTGAEPGADDPDASASVGVEKLLAGTQPLARRYVINALRDAVGQRFPEASPMFDRLQRGELVELPVLPVDDHREARVLSVDVDAEAVELRLDVRFKDTSKGR